MVREYSKSERETSNLNEDYVTEEFKEYGEVIENSDDDSVEGQVVEYGQEENDSDMQVVEINDDPMLVF